MSVDRVLQLKLIADVSDIGKGLKQTEGRFKSFTRSAKSWGKAFAASVVISGIGKVGDLVTDAFDAIQQQEKLLAQTGAVIKSTGQAAGLAAEDIVQLADDIERLTGVEAEAVHEAENLLLTFTNVKGPIFGQATRAITDLSVAMGTSLNGAAVMVGKALNDPIAGLAALRRVGIQFTDQQEKVIAKLVRTGKVAKAQKIILKELERQFGGSAEAAGGTLSGKLQKLNNKLTGLLEDAIKPLIGPFTSFVDSLVLFVDVLTGDKDWEGQLGALAVGLGLVAAVGIITALAHPLLFLAVSIVALGVALNSLGPQILDDTAAGLDNIATKTREAKERMAAGEEIPLFGQAMIHLSNAIDLVPASLNILLQAVKTLLLPATLPIAAMVGLIDAFLTLLTGGSIEDAVGKFVGWVGTVVPEIDWGGLVPDIDWGAAAKWVSDGIGGLMDDFGKVVQGGIEWIIGLWNDLDFAIPAWTMTWDGWSIPVPKEVPGFLKDALGIGDSFQIIGAGSANIWSGTDDLIPDVKLAKGGIVTKPTLAMIGEGGHDEAVIPLDGKHGLGGTTINVHFNGVVGDPAEAGRKVVDVIKRYESRAGRSWRTA